MSAYLPVLIVGLLCLMLGLSYRLRASAQSLRMELAHKGEAFVADESMPASLRDQVSFMLDTAFGMRVCLLFSFVLLPVVVAILLNRRKRLAFLKDYYGDPAPRAKFDEIRRLHDRITLANHPLLLPLLELEILLVVPTVILLVALIRGRIPGRLNRDVVVTYLETRPMHLHWKHAA
jgi:hypothetical protein